ncbi:DUF6867 family protein [Telmatospirillum sp.]|uniref:DUF6867 family protein n=1 Tax=Telmatospirillum sp. TaxID=2079197 RepID=UPI00283D6A6B|nr:hypothetical protein [Telmatospirillum sp.]MDR3441249.1 hypothetical protein [Telmatospirillum sp.]
MISFQALFGTTPAVFIGITVVFMGGCAAMAGQALARTWRPWWNVLPYCLLLGGADRFLIYALFKGELLLLSGYLLDGLVLILSGALAYQTTRASQMANQYPWLYKRTGWLTWSERRPPPE